jgi:hypothetical protein
MIEDKLQKNIDKFLHNNWEEEGFGLKKHLGALCYNKGER